MCNLYTPLVYLDNCMFNRPFDEQGNIRIRLETEAKLYIQAMIKNKQLSLVWSYILDYENDKNPFFERKFAIEQWLDLSSIVIEQCPEIIEYAQQLVEQNIKIKDALHVACAVQARAHYFLSTDDKLLKKLAYNKDIRALNPVNFIQELADDY